jgi:hypothetical protein
VVPPPVLRLRLRRRLPALAAAKVKAQNEVARKFSSGVWTRNSHDSQASEIKHLIS